MSGPISGLYRISPLPMGPGIGAHKFTGAPERAVVFDAPDHVWQVEEFEPGLYRLTLAGGWYSDDVDGKVMVDVRVSPGRAWRIRRHGNSVYFIIEKVSELLPRPVWTLPHKIPREHVVLSEPREDYDHQHWYFKLIEREEEEIGE